ncbi:hypothetical protein PFISCL1PPCAC_25395, partial [Pristionchus fissidentatus]
ADKNVSKKVIRPKKQKDDKADASESQHKGSRKKTSVSKRIARSPSVKRGSAGPEATSPVKDKRQTTVRRADRKKKESISGASAVKTDKKCSAESTSKMTISEFEKFLEAEAESFDPFERRSKKKRFVLEAGRLIKAGAKSDEVPLQPSNSILAELRERNRRYANKTSIKANKSKKKQKKYKSSIEDKFTTKQ